MLQLSGNPIDHLPAGCFGGLTALSVLSLAYVSSDAVRLDAAVFDEVADSLTRLELDSSPGLLRAALESDAILARLGKVGHLSARSSDLVAVRDDLPSFLVASAVRLSSARWHCDRRLVWFRDWLQEAGDAASDASAKATAADVAHENRCASPRRLAGRTLFSLADDEFDASTAVPDRPAAAASPTSRPPATTHAVADGSSTAVRDLGSSVSPDQRWSGNFRASDEPTDSRPFHGTAQIGYVYSNSPRHSPNHGEELEKIHLSGVGYRFPFLSFPHAPLLAFL